MAILVSCLCGKRLKAPERLAGKRAKCPECGKVLEVPEVESEDSSSAYALAEEEDRNCPECGRKMKAETRRCTHCSLDIRTGPKAGEVVSQSVGECSICGGRLEDGKECAYCSHAQEALKAPAAKKGQNENQTEPAAECPNCGGPLDDAQECPQCEQVEARVQAALRKKSPPQPKGITCPKCGSTNCEKISLAKKAASAALRVGAAGFLGRILLSPLVDDADPRKTYRCSSCGAQW